MKSQGEMGTGTLYVAMPLEVFEPYVGTRIKEGQPEEDMPFGDKGDGTSNRTTLG